MVARQIRLFILLHLTVFEPLAAVTIDRDRVLVIRHIRALDHIVIFRRIGDAEGVAVKNSRRISGDLETELIDGQPIRGFLADFGRITGVDTHADEQSGTGTHSVQICIYDGIRSVKSSNSRNCCGFFTGKKPYHR